MIVHVKLHTANYYRLAQKGATTGTRNYTTSAVIRARLFKHRLDFKI